MQLEFFSFEDDIIEQCLNRYAKGGTLFVLPTNKSRREAAKQYQKNWDLPLARFCTMESWKEILFETNYPILKDQKQKLALYSALTPKDRQTLKLTDYSSSIDFFINFFEFWQELGEEMVDIAQVEKILADSESYQNWQLEHFRLICDIRQRYHNFLSREKLTDSIFLYNPENLNLNPIKTYEKVVIVNQFYFTALEKQILARIADKLILCLQIPASCYDKDNWEVRNCFSAAELENIRTEKVNIYNAKDEFTMLNRLLTVSDDTNLEAIVDFKHCEHLYSTYLSENKFRIECSPPFSSTTIHRFVKTVFELCSSLHKYSDNYTNRKLDYLPIKLMYKAIGTDAFIHYFTKNEETISALQVYINQLVRDEFKYIDLQKRFFSLNKPSKEIADILGEIFDYIESVVQIDSIEGLVDTLNFEHIYKHVCSEEEIDHSEATELFFDALMELESIESIGLIDNWDTISSADKRVIPYLEILLAILEEKRVKYYRKKTGGYRFMTLHDTRNLSFENLAILNLVEGVIPPTRKTPYLLSENQRRELGLKTYDDICTRERYYLYRLIAQAKEVHLFTYQNIETDTQISSYLEALRLQWQNSKPMVAEHLEINSNYVNFFGALLDEKENSFKPEKIDEHTFFRFSISADDKLNKLTLSPSSILQILDDPFVYYLNYELKLKPVDVRFPNELSPQFIGSFIHQIFAAIWQRLIEVYEGNRIHHNFIHTGETYSKDAIAHVWTNRADLSYKIPHNYGSQYFREIYLPTVQNSIENFFWEMHNKLGLSDVMIDIFPESKQDKMKKVWEISDKLCVELIGEADLRIHTPDKYLIFDMKTGSQSDKHKKQLMLYEYLYYNPEVLQKVISYIYYTKDKRLIQLKNEKAELDDLKDGLNQVLSDTFEQGYRLSEKAQRYEPLEFTRRDLTTGRRT